MGASPNQLSPRGTGLGNLFSPSTSHARRNQSNRNNQNNRSTRNNQNNQVGSLPYSAQAKSISLNEG